MPPYLDLLHLGPGAGRAVEAVRGAVARSLDLENELIALLEQDNWRPHLPAAVAIGLGHCTAAVVAALWRAFDRGSWVAPQLGAAAFLADADFERASRVRIESLCLLDASRMNAMDPLVRHVSAGPAGYVGRSPKGLATLIGLAGMRDAWSAWLTPLASRDEARRLLAADQDRSGDIATRWLREITQLAGGSLDTAT